MMEMAGTASSAANGAWLSQASYWNPAHIMKSAWLGHAPFAFWIMDAIRPRAVVELGTHFGFSYFVFCEAIVRLGLDSNAFALDTWLGDDQTGRYGEDVIESVAAINDRDYARFSHLIRGYFDDSLDAVPDGGVDLLHIDGRHGLDDVTHDFNTWLPKLSAQGVILFHDVAERVPGFGVWKFWESVSEQYPSFAFAHSHGLGVLGVGSDLPAPLLTFFTAADAAADTIRATYEALGHEVEKLGALHERAELAASLSTEVAQRDNLITDLRSAIQANAAEIERLRQEVSAMQTSASWAVTRPLRAIRSVMRWH